MRVFECQNCDQPLYFENVACERCGMSLGFGPARTQLFAIVPQDDHWIVLGEPDRPRRMCRNAQHGVCNWLVDAEDDDPFCRACRHNHTIPDLTRPYGFERWTRLEQAKRRLFYTLINLRLPLITRAEDPVEGLAFEFLEELPGGPKVLTGHASGLITINIAEADDVERERARTQMSESYRTLLGHMRHEIAHWYWDRLVRDDPDALARFRDLFGDDRLDYATALQNHHNMGPPADWRMRHVSAYASSHPWEDFAESFAHYLHIVDALETARAFGLSVKPRVIESADMSASVTFDPYRVKDAHDLIDAWLPIAFAVNSLNRSMGQADLYPFILSLVAIEKMAFIHELTHARPMESAPPPGVGSTQTDQAA